MSLVNKGYSTITTLYGKVMHTYMTTKSTLVGSDLTMTTKSILDDHIIHNITYNLQNIVYSLYLDPFHNVCKHPRDKNILVLLYFLNTLHSMFQPCSPNLRLGVSLTFIIYLYIFLVARCVINIYIKYDNNQ